MNIIVSTLKNHTTNTVLKYRHTYVTHMHTYTSIHTHAHTHTQTYTHTHTHTQCEMCVYMKSAVTTADEI